MSQLECDDCGTVDAVAYIETDYGARYCGHCCTVPKRRPAKQRGERVKVKPADESPRLELRRPLYRMHDTNNAGCFLIGPNETPDQWQQTGHGIFWAVNRFRGGVRRVEALEQILAWAIDIDHGTKAEMRQKFLGAPLVPSMVVETKRGYQAYWNAKDGRPEHWNAIVLDRLVPYFGADQNARDLARVLRAPGYLHLKDPAAPFLVQVVHQQDVAYTEAQMVAKFPDANKAAREQSEKAQVKWQAKFAGSDDFWERVYLLDCEEGLRRLSGHPATGGEVYTFKTVSSGNKNILVNGKGTSCWIDRNGHIGSLAGGGPTLAQWLRFFGLTYGEAAKVIKELFPEIVK